MNKRWPAAVALAGLGWYAADSLRHRREGSHGYELAGEVDPAGEDFLRTAEALTGAPISYGNTIELLINGDEIFPVFLETLRNADESINLLTYIYWTGQIAEELAETLCRKAAEGVECNVILDAVGAAKMDGGLVRKMEEAGVEVLRFRPPKLYAVRRLTRRTHRKVLVADGRVGMTGGVGIAAQWEGNAEDPDHWRDTHVRVRGPVVRGLMGAFAENWLEATGRVLSGEDYLPDLPAEEEGAPMHVIRSSSGVGDTNVETLYFLALASAKRSIELTSAYFAPRPAFTRALAEAAERGVDVRVLVPGSHIDKEVVRRAGRAGYEELLEAGVRIFEFTPTMLHAKTLSIDGVWSTVGSVNFDNRSFQLNDEVTLGVQSEAFAAKLHDVFEADLERSEEFTLERWRARPLAHRAKELGAKLLRREL
jgi:cardiolipin synthase A/B